MKKHYLISFIPLIIGLFLSINLLAQNQPPIFTSTPITSINENETYIYHITTNDTDGDVINITAPTLPSWLTLTTNNVSTFAGSGCCGGFADGIGTSAQFAYPYGLAIDNSGNIYVADEANHKIRKITPAGVVTTLAGSTQGYADGAGSSAKFDWPMGVAVDASGNVYVADRNNNKIRKISSSGIVTTLAGSSVGYVDATGTAAKFYLPTGIAVDASGNVYVADSYNQRIRKITPGGVVTTFAGSSVGSADGVGTSAQFNTVTGVAVDASGNIFVADYGNDKIRKITSTGVVTTLAGSGVTGFADGAGTVAQFSRPYGISVDASGNVYVADRDNNKIRKITSAGFVTTLAGNYGIWGQGGYVDGSGADAYFYHPRGVIVDTSGDLFIADSENHRIRKIIQGTVITGDTSGKIGTHNVVLNANDSNGGSTNQSFSITVNDITAPTVTSLMPSNGMTGVLIGSNFTITFDENVQVGTGNMLIKDRTDNSIVASIDVIGNEVSISGSTVTINPNNDLLTNKNYYISIPNTAFKDMATTPNSYIGISDNTSWYFATEVIANTPPTFTSTPVTSIDENETYYYNITTSDIDADEITLTTPTIPSWLSLGISKTATPFVGSTNGFNDGTGTTAQFDTPNGITVDSYGNIFVVDTGNNRIRKITPDGVVTTLAGSGTAGFADGTGTLAQFNIPKGIAIDASNNLYIADTFNNRIRKITSNGVVTTLAGSGTAGFADGNGTLAQFNSPRDVAVDDYGNVYVADMSNHKIRKITSSGIVTTFAGSTQGFVDGNGTSAQFNYPRGVTVDPAGNIYVADTSNNRIRKISPTGVVTTLAGSSTAGYLDGAGTSALFRSPTGISVYSSGNIYVADSDNNMIRKISPAGVVTSFFGPGLHFAENGSAFNSQLNAPLDIIEYTSGIFYIADAYSDKIRKLVVSNKISGNANGHLGTHNVILNANDSKGGSTNQSFTITVNDVTPPTASSVAISGTLKVGNQLTGTYNYNDNYSSENGSIYKWYRSNNSYGSYKTVITGATSTTYTLVTADAHKYINFEVTPKDGIQFGNTYKSTLQVVANSLPTVSNVTFSGTLKIDQQLTATYTYADTDNDTENGSTYKWYRSDDALGTNKVVISGATTKTYTLVANDADKYISFEVTPKDGIAFGSLVESTLQGAVIKKTPTITFSNITKTYGDADFNLGATSNSTGTISYSIVAGGTGTATLSSSNNQTVTLGNPGTVTIRVSQTADADYNVTTKDITLTINTKPITITADAKSKVYGDADPSLTYQITSGSLVGTDTLTGVLSRTAGESVGIYIINQNTLSGGANYNLTYISADLTISAASVVATTQAASNITTTGAVLNGTLNDGGATTTASFEYSTASDLTGATTSSGTPASITLSSGTTSVSLTLTSLADNTIYYYRIKGTNTQGVVNGTIMSFTTLDGTPPSIVTTVPDDDATGITSSNLEITFNENIQKGTGDILIKKASDGSVIETIAVTNAVISISNATVTLTLGSILTLPSNTALYVEISNMAFTDMVGNAFPGLSLNTTWNFSTDTVLGIENNIIKGFSFYPNPVKDILTISAKVYIKQIQIFNLLGQQVVQKKANDNKVLLDVSSLPQGTYFAIITTDKTRKSVKFIKQ